MNAVELIVGWLERADREQSEGREMARNEPTQLKSREERAEPETKTIYIYIYIFTYSDLLIMIDLYFSSFWMDKSILKCISLSFQLEINLISH